MQYLRRPRPRMRVMTDLPSQQAPQFDRMPPSYDPGIIGDAVLDAAPVTFVPPEEDERHKPHVITHPGGIDMTVAGGVIVAPLNRLNLALPSNRHRKRFIIINPDDAPSTLYVAFGNNPSCLIPLIPGALWDESGSMIARNEIWVGSVTVGHEYGGYEGIPDWEEWWK